MIRLFDVFFSVFGLIIVSPILLLLCIIGWFDTRAPIFHQIRVGWHQVPFTLVKFRTMKPGTASVATHLTDASAVTPFGHFLRRTKLDELPQLWNVLKGDMSLVGPRPCLPKQLELVKEREFRRVFSVRPGITGLAQIRGIDMSTPKKLAIVDAEMIESMSFSSYSSLIVLTMLGKGSGDKIKRKS